MYSMFVSRLCQFTNEFHSKTQKSSTKHFRMRVILRNRLQVLGFFPVGVYFAGSVWTTETQLFFFSPYPADITLRPNFYKKQQQFESLPDFNKTV